MIILYTYFLYTLQVKQIHVKQCLETYYIKEDSLRILVKKQKNRIDKKNCVELLFKKDEKIMELAKNNNQIKLVDYGSSEEDQEKEEVTEREEETKTEEGAKREEEIDKEAKRDENEEKEDESTSEKLDINLHNVNNEDEYENDELECYEEHFEDLFDEDSSFEEAYVDIEAQNKDLVESMNKLALNLAFNKLAFNFVKHYLFFDLKM